MSLNLIASKAPKTQLEAIERIANGLNLDKGAYYELRTKT